MLALSGSHGLNKLEVVTFVDINLRSWEPERANIDHLDSTCADQHTSDTSQLLSSRTHYIFWHQLAIIITINQSFTNRQVPPDYFCNVIVREEVKANTFCRFAMLQSHFTQRISFWKNWVVSLLLAHPTNKVEQDGCERAAEDQNCADAAHMMEL